MLYFYLLSFILFLNFIDCIKDEHIKNVKLDYYYEVKLDKYNGTYSMDVKDIYNQTIIKLSKEMYYELLYTGSGILPNNTIINLYKNNKFEYVNSKYNYTLGINNNELIPNRSISTNIFKFGTYIYIENYKENGLGSITKDGCFRVDDNNGEKNKITIFTGKKQFININETKILYIYKDKCSF